MAQLMEGEISRNRPDSGNMNRARFYVCPACGNILFSTGGASVFCCGRKLEPLCPAPQELGFAMTVEQIDGDYYITVDHPMEKGTFFLLLLMLKVNGCILSACIQNRILRSGSPFYPAEHCTCTVPGTV